ncbi:MAG: hypothetical protein HQL39_16875 [Alphaproteobacteria bacterium]|nr:hypothetical protein [Alphaproteobacteria bacterium]
MIRPFVSVEIYHDNDNFSPAMLRWRRAQRAKWCLSGCLAGLWLGWTLGRVL